MRIIQAETGRELEIKDISTVKTLKQNIDMKTHTKPSNQILLTLEGIQLKDQENDLDPLQIIVLFNRRLLKQDPTALRILSEEYYKEEPTSTREETCSLPSNDPAEICNLTEIVVDNCIQRQTCIETVTQEIISQSLAVNAALNNLETHTTTANQTFEKFDRIAQREFAKDAVSIAQIDLDIELLVHIQPHPRLHFFFKRDDVQQQQQFKTDLLHQYDALVTATLEQKNKIVYLNQQTANVNVNRTTFDMMVDRVTKLTADVRLWVHQQTKALPLESLSLYKSKIQNAEKSILKEKKASVAGFVRCMHAVSQVEQSVSQIYPRLAELETKIKALRLNIEKGQGVVAKKRIIAYGVLLTELWRRDKYTEIVTKNASLLGDLFFQFGKKEEKYRTNFLLENQSLLDNDMQEDILDDLPVICQISLNAANVMEDTTVITKKEVEAYIQTVNSFYASNAAITGRRSKPIEQDISLPTDIPCFLNLKLERETKRLTRGLVQLGLPSNRPNSNMNMSSSILLNTKDVSTSNVVNHGISLARKYELEKASHQQDLARFETDNQTLLQKLSFKEDEISAVKSNYEQQIQKYEDKLQELERALQIKEKELLDYKTREKRLTSEHQETLVRTQVREANLITKYQQTIKDMHLANQQEQASLQHKLELNKPKHQYTFKEMEQELKSVRKELFKSQQASIHLQQEQKVAKRITNDLMSMITTTVPTEDMGLTDMLRSAIFNLANNALGSHKDNTNDRSMMIMMDM